MPCHPERSRGTLRFPRGWPTFTYVWSERKRVEKLRYMHRNPVTRGLVERPKELPWSSFRHYLTGEEAGVEIESPWTARRREHLGIYPTLRRKKSL